MKKRIFLLLVVAASYTVVPAQSASEKYQTETIYLSGNKYIKNGKKYDAGLFGGGLKKEMAVSPEAVIEFNRYEKKRNTGLVLMVVGLGSYFTAIAADSASDELRAGLLIGGLGTTIVSIPFGIQSTKSYHKAIWLRNGAVLK